MKTFFAFRILCSAVASACFLSAGVNLNGQTAGAASSAVGDAPEFSKWTVEYRFSSKPGEEGIRPTAPSLVQNRIVKSEVTKTKDIKWEVNSYDGGLVQDLWTSRGLQVLKDPSYEHKIVRRKASEGDFPDFRWTANAKNRGMETVEGRECLVYESEMYPLEFSNPGLFAAEMASDQKSLDLGQKVPVVAYIEAKSKLPVKLTIGADSRLYTFQAPPKSALVVPADYQSAIGEVEQRYQAISKPLSRP